MQIRSLLIFDISGRNLADHSTWAVAVHDWVSIFLMGQSMHHALICRSSCIPYTDWFIARYATLTAPFRINCYFCYLQSSTGVCMCHSTASSSKASMEVSALLPLLLCKTWGGGGGRGGGGGGCWGLWEAEMHQFAAGDATMLYSPSDCCQHELQRTWDATTPCR